MSCEDGDIARCEVFLASSDGKDIPFTPGYEHASDAGADLRSGEDFVLKPFERRLVPTGISIALPDGYVGLVHPRSGLAVKHGVTILNAPGTVDAGFRGELKLLMVNLDPVTPWECKKGERIAQLVIQRYTHANFVPVEELPESDRGVNGWGSTG